MNRGVPNIAVVERALDAGARAAAKHTGRTPYAALVAAGVSAEAFLRRAVTDHQERMARWCGVASREEVLRLRELVRALEHRLEEVDQRGSTAEFDGEDT
jgi:ubiquinone biosynthesis protein UbiJ